ncbi:MAG: hypothetical protein JWQ09_4935, partial [Segetibacter sp.]|nr:hypothetical protein [Segetibacter sp.]
MQSLNDDMDELFRRAGEEYPLNTNAANWDKVMQKLHHAIEDLPEENKKKKDYRYLLLLLLLPIGFMIGRYKGNENKATVAETNKEVKAAPASSGKTQPTTPGAAITGIKAKEHSSKGSGTKEVESKEVINNKVNNTAGNLHGSNADKFASNNIEKKPVITRSEFNASLMKAGMPEKVRKNNENNLLSNISPTRDSEDLKDGENVTTGKIPSAVADNGAFNSQQPSLQTDTSTVADTNKKNNITPEQNAVPVASKESKNRKLKTFKPQLSYSFVIGPDLSIVKLQRTSNAGYSVGLMLGYQVSSKMTVEGGALWDRKN